MCASPLRAPRAACGADVSRDNATNHRADGVGAAARILWIACILCVNRGAAASTTALAAADPAAPEDRRLQGVSFLGVCV